MLHDDEMAHLLHVLTRFLASQSGNGGSISEGR